MSGAFRKRIGPIRKRVSDLLPQTESFDPVPIDLSSEEYLDIKVKLVTLIDKLSRQTAYIEDWDKQYINYLTSVDDTD